MPASRLKRWYIELAVGFLNAVLLLVLINLALYVVFRLSPASCAQSGAQLQPSTSTVDKLQAAYPGWKEEDVRALLERDSTRGP